MNTAITADFHAPAALVPLKNHGNNTFFFPLSKHTSQVHINHIVIHVFAAKIQS